MLNSYRKKHSKKGESMYYLLATLIGVIFGGVITYLTVNRNKKPSGSFVIDISDPMKDICRLELEESLESIYSKDQIILNVKKYIVSHD